jgi:GNAT superfamily N-acetyltransferase
MPDSFCIRPAQPQDRDAVLALDAKIWDGQDYIPEVWDEWLADSANPLLVGEDASGVVALARLSSAGPGQAWLQGLRVAVEARGRGYARQLLAHQLKLARRRGETTVRLMTDEDNYAVHHLSESLGFRLVSVDGWFVARAQPGPFELVTLPVTDAGRLFAEAAADPFFRPGLMYPFRWRYQSLNLEWMRTHLADGQVWGLPGTTAWAIADPDWGWLSYLRGSPAEMTALAANLLRHPDLQPDREMFALLPNGSPQALSALAAGYEGQAGERCYEITLPPA